MRTLSYIIDDHVISRICKYYNISNKDELEDWEVCELLDKFLDEAVTYGVEPIEEEEDYEDLGE